MAKGKAGKVAFSTGSDDQDGSSAMGKALGMVGVKPEDFEDTPQSRATRIARIAERRRKVQVVTLEDLGAKKEEHRKRIASERAQAAEVRRVAVVKEDEETSALVGTLQLDVLGVILNDLKVRAVLSAKPRRSDEEEAALKMAVQALADVDFDNWHPGEKALLLNGVPEAQDPELRQGLTSWIAEQEAARKAAYQARRGEQDVARQDLVKLATTHSLHEALSDSGTGHIVYVNESYTHRRYDEATRRMMPVQRPDGSGPQTRTGTFLLTVTEGGKFGQIVHTTVNMPFVQEVPHPENPVPNYPDRDFATDRGEPFYHNAVQEMLTAKWYREEREAKEKAEREERRRTDITLEQLLAGVMGRAHGRLDRFQSRDGKRDGSLDMWVRGDGSRIYMSECLAGRPSNGREAWDFANFPKEGIALAEEGKYWGAGLVRVILHRMVAEAAQKALHEQTIVAYNSFCEEDGNTVEDMSALLDATSKKVFSRHFRWERGYGSDKIAGLVAMRVENTGRGKTGRKVRVVRCFATEASYALEVGTEVSASLALPQEASDQQRMLASMLRYLSGRKVNGNGPTQVEPAPETTDPAGEAPEPKAVP